LLFSIILKIRLKLRPDIIQYLWASVQIPINFVTLYAFFLSLLPVLFTFVFSLVCLFFSFGFVFSFAFHLMLAFTIKEYCSLIRLAFCNRDLSTVQGSIAKTGILAPIYYQTQVVVSLFGNEKTERKTPGVFVAEFVNKSYVSFLG
jgi:hypothetical protein